VRDAKGAAMRVGPCFRLAATVFSVLAIGALAGSGVASAATPQIGVWQAPVVLIPNVYSLIYETTTAISCASAGNCSAVGTFDGTLDRNGSASYEGFVVSETHGVWGTAQEVAADNDDLYRFTAISCSSPGNCAAVGAIPASGEGLVMDETAGAWGAPQSIVGSASLSSVSCPSDGDCTAAGSSGYGGQALAVSESGGTWGTAEVLPGPLNTDAGLTSISCSSAGKCSAGGYYDAQPDGPLPGEGYPLVAEETGGTWGSVQDLNGSFNDVADDDVDAVSSVSCSSAGNCSAGGYYGTFDGASHAFVVSESDGTWGQVVETAQSLDKNGSAITSISCPSDGNCSAGGYYVDGDDNQQVLVIEETDGVWQPAQEVAGSLNADGYAQITSISCASTGNCSAAGYYATETALVGLVVTETDGSWDSGQDVATSPISSISCPSVDNCVAVGDVNDEGDRQLAFAVAEVPENAQTITFTAPSQGTVNGSAVLTPSASSGLAVALSVDASTTNDACTLDGDTVIYRHAGSCVLDANQAGNATFAAAPQVQRTINVGNAAQTLPVQALPVDVTPPVISGTLKAGRQLTCSTGSWANDPTGFAFQWIRNGTPLDGATGDTYALGTLDEGTTLTCVVTASNAAGRASATSNTVKVPIPYVLRCPGAAGTMTGTTIGQIQLGMTRSRARFLYRRHSNRGKQYEDFFCLTPIGVRVGYASPRLLRHLSRREQAKLNGTVVWSSTSDPYYSLDGIRAGESIATASRVLDTEPPFHIGRNYWYLARKPGYTAALKVRRGVVEELGIATNALTKTRKAQSVLMHSFY
jgi:hypothetical protein